MSRISAVVFSRVEYSLSGMPKCHTGPEQNEPQAEDGILAAKSFTYLKMSESGSYPTFCWKNLENHYMIT